MKNWDIIANKYNELVGETGDIYHKTYINPVILKILGNIKNKRILDIACGQGYFSRILYKKGAKVTGIDISKQLLSLAKDKKLNDIKYFCRNSAKLTGIKNKSFDIIVSNMSFHDIKDIKNTIKECSRVLKTNGHLIFSIPHPWHTKAERIKYKNNYYLKVYGYKNKTTVEHFMNNEIKVYHRPIDFYLKEFFKNKFVVSDFIEIGVKHHKMKKITDSKLLAHKKEIPSFLIVELIKTS